MTSTSIFHFSLAALLAAAFLMVPASAWLGGYAYRRNQTGDMTQLIMAVNGTFGSDIDEDGQMEWIYGQYGNLYYNSEKDVGIGNATDDQQFSAMSFPGMATAGSPLPNMPYFFPLDRANASAVDLSGYGNNGTLGGTPTPGATGVLGSAYDFTGGVSADYIDLTWPASTDWTVALWVNPDDITNTRIMTGYVDWGSNANGEFMLRFTSSAIYLYVYKNGGWQEIHTSNLIVNQWYHVVAKKDTDDFTIYINGTANVTNTLAGTWATTSAGADFYIGGAHDDTSNFFDGTIDHYMFFNESLTDDEVMQLFNGTFYGELGEEESLGASINLAAETGYFYVNETVTFNASWDSSFDFQKFWWNFGDGNFTVDVHPNSSYCYQESADEATGCGGLATGNYSCTFYMTDCANIYDGDWDTYGDTASNIYDGYIYINYSLPDRVNDASIWRVKHGSYVLEETMNFTVPSGCLSQSHLWLRWDGLWKSAPPYVRGSCWNGSTWSVIYSNNSVGAAPGYLYEEAMYWAITADYLSDYHLVYHAFSTSGDYTVNVTAYEENSAVNVTDSAEVTIYDRLSAVNITIYDYLPFLFKNSTHYLGYSATGGTAVLNSSWSVTLPNASVFTYVNQSPLSFTPTATGTHTIALTVCDLMDGSCASDSDTYRPWNVTGGTFLVDSYNKTDFCLAEVFEGDSASFNSTDSLLWNMSTQGFVGTSATFVFNSSYAYYNNTDYFHFNLTVHNAWGSYTSDDWFTAIAARYSLNTSGCGALQHAYCFICGGLYNEETEAQITANNSWDAYFMTSDAYGHEEELGVGASAVALNISFCMNATPLLSSITLDGWLAYGSANYVDRTYAFDGAEMSFVSACTYANGHLFDFYTLSNTTSVYTVTFTVLDGGVALDDALLKVQAYSNISQSWFTVASQLTDDNGQAQIPLKLCPTYYKLRVEQDGELLHEEKLCLKSTTHTVEVERAVNEFYTLFGDVSSTCAYSESGSYFSCSISDPSGKTVLATLNLYTSAQFGSTTVCSVGEASTSTTLVCSTSSLPDGDYKFKLIVTTATDTYIVDSGGFTIGTTTGLTPDGPVVALALILTLLLATRLPPPVMVALATGGFLVVRGLKLITTTYMLMGQMLAVGLIALMGVIGRER